MALSPEDAGRRDDEPREPEPPADGLGDLTGKVVIFRAGTYSGDFEVPSDHPFLVDGGFGARIADRKIFGLWLDGAGRDWGRREWVDRVIETEELSPEQRDLLPPELKGQ